MNNQVFNVGGDIATNVNELARVTAEIWDGANSNITHLDGRNEVLHAESDHKKLNCFFPGLPKPVDLRTGMTKMVNWAKDTGKYFEPVHFDAVELMKKLPPSWITEDLKEVPAFVHNAEDNVVETGDNTLEPKSVSIR